MSLTQTTGQINVSNNFIHNVLNPVLPQDLATKNYVDSSLTGINLYSAGSNSVIAPGGGSGPNMVLRGIVAGTSIFITSGGTSLTIYSSGALTLINTGTGLIGGPISTSGTVSLIVPVIITNGGTNSTTALNGTGIIISNGSSIVQGPTGSATTILHGGVTGPFYSQINLITDVTGILPVVNGGTGQSSYASGALLIGNNASGLSVNTLTAGSNITITNGNGTINVASSITTGENAQVFTSGTGVWPIPGTINFLRFTLIGAGGAGGAGSQTGSGRGSGGGGGGGSYVNSFIIPKGGATSLQYFVGAGGVGSTGTSTAGGVTEIIINNMSLIAYAGGVGGTGATVSASGGGGGGSASSGSSGASGGAGGTANPTASATNYGIIEAVGGNGGGGGTTGGTGLLGSFTALYFFIMTGASGGGGSSSIGVAGGNGGTSILTFPPGLGGAGGANVGGAGGGAGGWGGGGGNGGAGGGATGFPGANGIGYGSGGGGGGACTSATGVGMSGNGATGLIIIEFF